VDGFSFYSYGDLESEDLWSFLAEGPFRETAVVPAMPWKATTKRPQAAPSTGG
jgi:hypothetical protein